MLDLNTVNKRYFNVKIGIYELELEPCKLKTLRKFTKLKDDDLDDMIDIILTIVNKNRKNIKVPIETIEELDILQMKTLLNDYFEWQMDERNNNPN